ncbi:MAG: 50S ribosomal protein L11 [Phycisphaerae bacterium]|jgi:large subunit ribosomal protein L11|nr:50S ribosomal protein L11 [Phycisphaerae bacterium]MDP7288923.1 50S ribosomal protein L11 [Phycisphaerae bacterium]
MAKQITGTIKLQAAGGQATPAPPIGPALGAKNVNIGQFVSQFNERTKDFNGMPIPVVITIYGDNTFDFVCKSPPASALLKEAAQIASGSGTPNKEKVASVTMDQIRTIAERKIGDLNATDIDAASRIIIGTAKAMGITVEN